MGPIDFSGLFRAGIVIGIVVGVALVGIGYGVWWIVGHLGWVS